GAPGRPAAPARVRAELRELAAFLADRPIRHALVLGGSGFLGAPLVRRLSAAGVRTTCLLHRTPPPVATAGVLRGSLDRFPWRTLEADPPDVIFHLARIAGRGGIRGAMTRVRNRVANERLLLALASWARPPLLVYVGGTLAYGSHGEEPVTERTPLAPTSFSRDYHIAEVPWLRAPDVRRERVRRTAAAAGRAGRAAGSCGGPADPPRPPGRARAAVRSGGA